MIFSLISLSLGEADCDSRTILHSVALFLRQGCNGRGFAFRSRKPDREILVTVNQRTRGYRNQINTLNVLDVYPEVPPDEWQRIIGALCGATHKVVDAAGAAQSESREAENILRNGFSAPRL